MCYIFVWQWLQIWLKGPAGLAYVPAVNTGATVRSAPSCALERLLAVGSLEARLARAALGRRGWLLGGVGWLKVMANPFSFRVACLLALRETGLCRWNWKGRRSYAVDSKKFWEEAWSA